MCFMCEKEKRELYDRLNKSRDEFVALANHHGNLQGKYNKVKLKNKNLRKENKELKHELFMSRCIKEEK